MLIHKNSPVKFNGQHRLHKPLEPLRGCQYTDMLRLYRLTEAERKLFRVERDNPGVIAVIA